MPDPSVAEAAAFGLTVEQASGDPVAIWPDNVQTVNVFVAMSTQWRASLSGATGLDYAALPFVMRTCGVRAVDRAEVFAGVRAMEFEALVVMRENRKE
jgi:hypothetical protein